MAKGKIGIRMVKGTKAIFWIVIKKAMAFTTTGMEIDTKGNGRMTCAKAKEHNITPMDGTLLVNGNKTKKMDKVFCSKVKKKYTKYLRWVS